MSSQLNIPHQTFELNIEFNQVKVNVIQINNLNNLNNLVTSDIFHQCSEICLLFIALPFEVDLIVGPLFRTFHSSGNELLARG